MIDPCVREEGRADESFSDWGGAGMSQFCPRLSNARVTTDSVYLPSCTFFFALFTTSKEAQTSIQLCMYCDRTGNSDSRVGKCVSFYMCVHVCEYGM